MINLVYEIKGGGVIFSLIFRYILDFMQTLLFSYHVNTLNSNIHKFRRILTGSCFAIRK